MSLQKYKAWLLITGISVCLLTGCVKTLDTLQPENGVQQSDVQESQDKKDAKEQETVTENMDESETKGKESENEKEDKQTQDKALEFAMRDFSLFDYNGKENGPTFSAQATYPMMVLSEKEAEKYPKLQDALIKQSKKWYDQAKSSLSEMSKVQKEILDDMTEDELAVNEYYMPTEYTSEDKGVLYRADDKIVSVMVNSYSYMGGAHPFMGYASFNYNPETGEKLALADVVSDVNDLPDIIKKHLYKEYEDLKDSSQSVDEYFTNEDMVKSKYENIVWTIGYDGMHFGFSDYALGSYAMGNYVLDIPFSDLEGILNEAYLSVPDTYMVPALTYFDTGYGISIEPDTKYYDEYDFSENVGYTLTYKDTSIYEDLYYYSLEPMLVKMSDGSRYLFVEVHMEDDYSITKVYKLPEKEGEQIRHLNQVDVYKSYQAMDPMIFGIQPEYEDEMCYIDLISMDPDHMKLYSRIDILGTGSAYSYYKLTENGIVQDSKCYWYDINSLQYTTHLELTADVVDAQEDIVLQLDVRIPVGQKITFYRTDEKTYMDVKLEDDRIIRLKVTRDKEGYELINGVKAYDAFGELWYAG